MIRAKHFVLYFVLYSFTITNIGAETDNVIVKPYGFLKFDMAYDRARTNNGNYVFWVDKSSKRGNSEFNMTVRQTKLGANLSYDELKKKIVTARLEFDFYGGGEENKNMPMMRFGYFKVDFGKYYLLAGQSSDIISPLVPTTVNYTVLWNCGNIGYRHPQIQFGKKADNGIEIVGALSRNISGDFDNDGNDDGEDSAFPTIQARLSYINQKINAGFSGHYGKMEFTNFENYDSCTSYSFNFHLNYSMSDAFLIKGEFFTGKTLNQYFGGIGQGFDVINKKRIVSSGGWINAAYKSSRNTLYNIGMGIDQPKKDKTLAIPNRDYNMSVFGNVFAKIAQNTTLAVEISNWTTSYYNNNGDTDTSSNLRFHTSIILNL